MKFDRIITIILLLVICLVAFFLVKNTTVSEDSAMKGSMPFVEQIGQTDSQIVNVRTTIIESKDYKKTARFFGELKLREDPQSVYADISGTVQDFSVRRGDSVKVGDTIASVDPSTAGAKYVPRSVKTHVEGIVESIDAHVGEQISAQVTSLLTVSNPHDLMLSITIPERYLSVLEIGQQAEFRTVAWSDFQVESTVTYIGTTVNSTNRTVNVELSVPEDSRLKAGMFVQVELYTEIISDALLVPSEAVTTYLGEHFVYVARDNTAVRTQVTIGSSTDQEIAILSGLQAGDTVITAGTVSDGSAIQIIEEQL